MLAPKYKHSKKVFMKRNKVRTNLLILANTEISIYLRNCNVLLNSEFQKILARNSRVYDGIIIHDFVNVLTGNTQKDLIKYLDDQVVKDNMVLKINLLPESKDQEAIDRIKMKSNFHRKLLVPKMPSVNKDDVFKIELPNNRVEIRKATNSSRDPEVDKNLLCKSNRRIRKSKNTHVNDDNYNKLYDGLIKRKKSIFITDKEIKLSELFLTKDNIKEKAIQKSLNKLKQIVFKIKGNENNLTEVEKVTRIKTLKDMFNIDDDDETFRKNNEELLKKPINYDFKEFREDIHRSEGVGSEVSDIYTSKELKEVKELLKESKSSKLIKTVSNKLDPIVSINGNEVKHEVNEIEKFLILNRIKVLRYNFSTNDLKFLTNYTNELFLDSNKKPKFEVPTDVKIVKSAININELINDRIVKIHTTLKNKDDLSFSYFDLSITPDALDSNRSKLLLSAEKTSSIKICSDTHIGKSELNVLKDLNIDNKDKRKPYNNDLHDSSGSRWSLNSGLEAFKNLQHFGFGFNYDIYPKTNSSDKGVSSSLHNMIQMGETSRLALNKSNSLTVYDVDNKKNNNNNSIIPHNLSFKDELYK